MATSIPVGVLAVLIALGANAKRFDLITGIISDAPLEMRLVGKMPTVTPQT